MGLKRKYIRFLRWLRLLPRNRKMTFGSIMNRTLRRCWAQVADSIKHSNSYYLRIK